MTSKTDFGFYALTLSDGREMVIFYNGKAWIDISDGYAYKSLDDIGGISQARVLKSTVLSFCTRRLMLMKALIEEMLPEMMILREITHNDEKVYIVNSDNMERIVHAFNACIRG